MEEEPEEDPKNNAWLIALWWVLILGLVTLSLFCRDLRLDAPPLP